MAEEIAVTHSKLFHGLPRTLRQFVLAVLTGGILAAGFYLRLSSPAVTNRTPDERMYTFQAGRIAADGLAGIRDLVRLYESDRDLWLYPPPSRLGHTVPLAWLQSLTGVHDPRPGSWISALASCMTLVLLTLMLYRYTSPVATIAGIAFLAVAPPDLVIARRAWQDSLMGFAGLLTIFACCEYARSGLRRHAWGFLAWFAGGWCILLKESGVLIAGLCAVGLGIACLFQPRPFHVTARTGIAIALAFLAAWGLQGILLGSFTEVPRIWAHIKAGIPTNAYARTYQAGPWYGLVQAYVRLMPQTMAFAAAGLLALMWPGYGGGPGREPSSLSLPILRSLTLFIIVFLILTTVAPLCLNLRYVSVTFPLVCLLAGLGVELLFSMLGRVCGQPACSLASGAVIVLILLGLWGDYAQYRAIFVDLDLMDLSYGFIIMMVP